MNFDLHISIDASPSNEKETKFAFDEATINPVSPVLSNSDSSETLAVVEVVDDMQNGCFIMIISENGSNTCDENKDHQPCDTNDNQTNHEKCFEWLYCTLSSDLQTIDTSDYSLNISDIRALNNLNANEAKEIQLLVEDDSRGLSVIGLQSITLVVELKHSIRHKLIFDSSRTAFVWYKGLKTLGGILAIQTRPSMVSFALVVIDIDRISNTIMNSNMPIVDNQLPLWLKAIEEELPVMSAIIDSYRSFAQRSCILDSSEHLSIMCRTMSLKKIVSELENYLSFIEITLSMISEIREFWWTLNSDLAVVILKTNNVRKQLQAISSAVTYVNENENITILKSVSIENKHIFVHDLTSNANGTSKNTNNNNGSANHPSNTKIKRNSITDRMKSTVDYFLHKSNV